MIFALQLLFTLGFANILRFKSPLQSDVAAYVYIFQSQTDRSI